MKENSENGHQMLWPTVSGSANFSSKFALSYDITNSE